MDERPNDTEPIPAEEELYPADPESNNLRVFVINSSVAAIEEVQ